MPTSSVSKVAGAPPVSRPSKWDSMRKAPGSSVRLVRRPVEQVDDAVAVAVGPIDVPQQIRTLLVEPVVLGGADQAERRPGDGPLGRPARSRGGGTDLERPGLARAEAHRSEVEPPEAAGIAVVRKDHDQAAGRDLGTVVLERQTEDLRALDVTDDRQRHRVAAAGDLVQPVDLAVGQGPDAPPSARDPGELARSLGRRSPDRQARQRCGAGRDQGRGHPGVGVGGGLGPVVEQVDRSQGSRLLLAPEQARQLGARSLALRQPPAKLVDLRQRLAVAELVEGEDLERFEEPLAEEGPVPRLAEVDRAALDVAPDDPRQVGRDLGRRRHRQAVGQAEEADVRAQEVAGGDVGLVQPVAEPGQHQRRRRERDAQLPDPGPQADRALSRRRARLVRGRHHPAVELRDQPVLDGLGLARRERFDRAPERVRRVVGMGAAQVLLVEVDGDQVLGRPRQVGDGDEERVRLALPHHVRMAEGQVEAGVHHLDRRLGAREDRQRIATRSLDLAGDVDGHRVGARGEPFDGPGGAPLLPGVEQPRAVGLDHRHPLSRRHRRVAPDHAENRSRRQPDLGTQVRQLDVRSLRCAVGDDQPRLEELVQVADAPGEHDGAEHREDELLVPLFLEAPALLRVPLEDERHDPRRLPPLDHPHDVVGQTVQHDLRLPERLHRVEAVVDDRQLDLHGLVAEGEPDGEVERLEVVLAEADPAGLEIGQRQRPDRRRRQDDLADVEQGDRGLGGAEDPSRGQLDQPDVLQPVLPLLLEPRQDEGAAGQGLHGQTLGRLRAAELGAYHQAGDARVPGQHRAARLLDATEAGPHPGPLADVDRLVGVGGDVVGVEGQPAALDQELAGGQRAGRSRGPGEGRQQAEDHGEEADGSVHTGSGRRNHTISARTQSRTASINQRQERSGTYCPDH